MPRGVAIPELRQQLFAAAERVIAREGPSKLSGRAITSEAGVATGLLHAHFTDFDGFLAAYAVDRAFLVSSGVAALPERAGTGSVAGNLRDAVLATPLAAVATLLKLLVSRPDLTGKVRAVLGEEAAGLDAIEKVVANYLATEQRLGRVAAAAEPKVLAFALVGVLHHVVLTGGTESEVRARLEPAVTALAGQLAATGPEPA